MIVPEIANHITAIPLTDNKEGPIRPYMRVDSLCSVPLGVSACGARDHTRLCIS